MKKMEEIKKKKVFGGGNPPTSVGTSLLKLARKKIVGRMKTEEVFEENDTKSKIIGLLDIAKEEICMSTGLNTEFYNDEELRQAIENSTERVKQFRIIVDGYLEEKKEKLSWLFDLVNKEKIKIRQKIGTPHWLIIDGKHFRLEGDKHPSTAIGTKNLFITDMEFALSEVIQYTFGEWWDNATSFK